jgi:ketosteroid isomerase-like protein
VSEAVVAGQFFSLVMVLDITPKAGGPSFTMEEICLYEVRDGKIVREQFFYPLHG